MLFVLLVERLLTDDGRLGQGDYFGEAALINESRRMASVIADGELYCYYLDRDAFSLLFTEDRLNVQFAKRNAISAEMVQDASKRCCLEWCSV